MNSFVIWNIFKFWLIFTTGAAKANEHFLVKFRVWKYSKLSGEPSKRTYRVPFLFNFNTQQRYLSHRKILISASEKVDFFSLIIHCRFAFKNASTRRNGYKTAFNSSIYGKILRFEEILLSKEKMLKFHSVLAKNKGKKRKKPFDF